MKKPSYQMVLLCQHEADSLKLGALLATRAYPGLIIRLEGGLGAGKTVFARGFARGLGIRETIASPTYPIIQEYSGRLPLFHMDLYRLGTEDEVSDVGVRELLGGSNVCLIEWPDRAGALIGPENLTISIRILEDQTREFHLSALVDTVWQALSLDDSFNLAAPLNVPVESENAP